MLESLAHHRTTFVSLWHAAPPARALPWPAYSSGEHRQNERRLQAFVDLLTNEARRARSTGTVGPGAEDRLREGFLAFASSTLGWGRPLLEELLDEFAAAMNHFRLEARRFDPRLSAADIYQGARNAITMLCLQRLLGVRVEVTPAVIGYSLLYPYTDNYLDDPSVEPASKAAFGQRFGERLAGRAVAPAGALEERVWQLVSMIEEQWPRERHPRVFQALLAIHAAQTRSIALLRSASPRDVIEIAVEKGGTSVLADGYLVAGELTAPQAECLYGLGVFLQLRDDLEDRLDDRRRGQATVFSAVPWYRHLDDPTTRALAIGSAVVERLTAFDHPAARPVRALMASSLLLTITDAAASARWRYRARYRRTLEKHSPFRLARLVRERRRVSRAHGTVSGVLEAWVTHSDTPVRTGGAPRAVNAVHSPLSVSPRESQ